MSGAKKTRPPAARRQVAEAAHTAALFSGKNLSTTQSRVPEKNALKMPQIVTAATFGCPT